jgi:hypothetical protein
VNRIEIKYNHFIPDRSKEGDASPELRKRNVTPLRA